MANPFINHILLDRYLQSEFSETWFRGIYVEMSMPFREHYATSPKPPFASNVSQNSYFCQFYCMNRCRFYISIYSFNFVQFGWELHGRRIFFYFLIFLIFPTFLNHGKLRGKNLCNSCNIDQRAFAVGTCFR